MPHTESRLPVVACDLDRTLIYSPGALGLSGSDTEAPQLVVAEVYRGVPISFYTRAAEALIDALAGASVLVPTTTRTREQYARVRLPGRAPAYAVTANGGHLLVGGEACPEWTAHVRQALDSGSAPLAEVVAHLDQVTDPSWLINQRVAEALFVYQVVERAALPDAFVGDLAAWCAERGWTVSLQGRKLYCVPRPLTKSAAIAEVRSRTGASSVLAAGDSVLDADLLDYADEAVRPAHGELHDQGWTRPHVSVTTQSGVLGGQELVARLLSTVLARS